MSKKRLKKGLALTVAFSMLLALAGCSDAKTAEKEEGEKKEKVLNIGTNTLIDSLDPCYAATLTSQQLLMCISEPLIRANKDGEYEVGTGLAKTMDANENHTEFTFHLKEGAKWSNGEDVTANDFLFAFQRSLNPENAVPYAQQLFGLKNAAAIFKGEKTIEELGAKAVDDYTLQLTFEMPVMNIAETVVAAVFLPQNETAVSGADAKTYATTPDTVVSCGPYVCSKMEGNETVEFTKNPDYYESKDVYFEKVVYQTVENAGTRINLFASGDLDFAIGDTTVSNEFDGKPEEIIQHSALFSYMCVNHNSPSGYLGNKNIRKGLGLAIDRETLLKVAGNGTTEAVGVGGTNQLGPKETSYTEFIKDKKFVQYDAEKAKEAFELGLKELNITKEDFSKTVKVLCEPSVEGIAKVITPQWKEVLGIDVQLDATTPQDQQARMLSGSYDLTITALNFMSDPMQSFSLFTSQSAFDFTHYVNPAYDELYMKTLMDGTDARYDGILGLEQILSDDQVVIPLYNNAVQLLANPDLTDLAVYPSGTLPDPRTARFR